MIARDVGALGSMGDARQERAEFFGREASARQVDSIARASVPTSGMELWRRCFILKA